MSDDEPTTPTGQSTATELELLRRRPGQTIGDLLDAEHPSPIGLRRATRHIEVQPVPWKEPSYEMVADSDDEDAMVTRQPTMCAHVDKNAHNAREVSPAPYTDHQPMLSMNQFYYANKGTQQAPISVSPSRAASQTTTVLIVSSDDDDDDSESQQP